MPAATFVARRLGATSGAAARAVSAFPVLNGDILVVFGFTGDMPITLATPTATGVTFTLRLDGNSAGKCRTYVWTAPITADNASLAVSATISSGAATGGLLIHQWRSHGGYGTTVSATGSGVPSVNGTDTGANSAWSIINTDWNATSRAAARNWRVVKGTLTETDSTQVSPSTMSYDSGYHADVGTAGTTEAMGPQVPTGQEYYIAAVEILAGAGGTDATVTGVPAAATGAVPIPTVSGTSTGDVTAPPADGLGDAPAPAASAGATVISLAATAAGSMPLTGNELSSEVTAPPAQATGDLPAPAATATSDGTVTAVPADATGAAPPPSPVAGSQVASPPGPATGAIPAPAVGGEDPPPTVLDDFNRTDGDVEAGDGATLWTGSTYTNADGKLVVIGNQLAASAASGGNVSLFELEPDFDVTFDVAAWTGGYVAFFFALADPLLSTFTGWYVTAELGGGGIWRIYKRTSGTSTVAVQASTTGLTGGHAIRVARVGDTITAYHSLDGGSSWTPVVTVDDSHNYITAPVAIEIEQTDTRLDNLQYFAASGDATVVSPPASATGDAPAPTATASATVTSPAADATGDFPAPAVSGGGSGPATESHPALGGVYDQTVTGGVYDQTVTGGRVLTRIRGGTVRTVRRGGHVTEPARGGVLTEPKRGGTHDESATGGEVL